MHFSTHDRPIGHHYKYNRTLGIRCTFVYSERSTRKKNPREPKTTLIITILLSLGGPPLRSLLGPPYGWKRFPLPPRPPPPPPPPPWNSSFGLWLGPGPWCALGPFNDVSLIFSSLICAMMRSLHSTALNWNNRTTLRGWLTDLRRWVRSLKLQRPTRTSSAKWKRKMKLIWLVRRRESKRVRTGRGSIVE